MKQKRLGWRHCQPEEVEQWSKWDIIFLPAVFVFLLYCARLLQEYFWLNKIIY